MIMNILQREFICFSRAVRALDPTTFGATLRPGIILPPEAARMNNEGFHTDIHMKNKTVRVVAEAFLQAKRLANLNSTYLHFIVLQIQVLIDLIGDMFIPDVRAQHISPLLCGVSPATARKRYHVYAEFFNFASSNSNMPALQNPVKALHPPRPCPDLRPPITPQQLQAVIDMVPDPRQKLALLLAAYAGLRLAEIRALREGDIISGEYIRVPSAKGCDRIVPIVPALGFWLGYLKGLEGCVLDSRLMRRLLILVRKNGRVFPWLRQSYIMYRLAQTRNIAQVAQETGHTLLHHHYRPTIIGPKASDVEAYFAITPESCGLKDSAAHDEASQKQTPDQMS